ncbi:MAG TPA: CdaR family protein [Gemmatimonadales bacterium]|nr:CdaR family protein [Gemmatimonadales bacterium]
MGIRGAIVRHWPLKLAALALAVILWVAVALEKPTTQLLGIQLDLVLAPDVAPAQEPPPIKALVSGPQRELFRLTAPLVIRAVVNASGVGAGARHHLVLAPSDVAVPSGVKVTVQDVEPREIDLLLDRRAQRTVAVRAMVQTDSGFALEGALGIAPPAVRVSGPRALVATLDSVDAEPLDLRGVAGSFERQVQLDTAGRAVLRMTPLVVTLSGKIKKT